MTLPKDAVAHLFDVDGTELEEFGPHHNICPTTEIPVLRSIDGRRRVSRLRWGFLPHWYKTLNGGPLLINARAETIADKPAFRAACRSRRCLIPATGFYEWQSLGDKGKAPWFIAPTDGSPLVMAGIWQGWDGEDGTRFETCAVVTCAANADLAPIHHRMPVVVAPQDFALWLGEAGKGAALLMRPAPDGSLSAHRVGPAVNKASARGAELMAPLPAL